MLLPAPLPSSWQAPPPLRLHAPSHPPHTQLPRRPFQPTLTTPVTPTLPLQIWEENLLLVQLGRQSLQEHCLALPAKAEGRPIPFGLQVDSGTVLVDDLVLYCHVEQQGVYDVDNSQLGLAQSVRKMNAALPEESFVKLWAD
jgi:hypothetical protein